MIRLDRLWATMKKKGVSQYRLIKDYNFSTGQLDRLRKRRQREHLPAESALRHTELRSVQNCRICCGRKRRAGLTSPRRIIICSCKTRAAGIIM